MGQKQKSTLTPEDLITDLDETWNIPPTTSKDITASQQTSSSTITAKEGNNMLTDETSEDTPSERPLRFNLNPEIRTIASNMDEPLEQLIGVFEKTLSNAFHNKPNAIKSFSTDDVNALPVKDYAQHLSTMYLQSAQLHDRDIHQIRFILAMYDERANLSDDTYHDVVSQVILFYHVLIYG